MIDFRSFIKKQAKAKKISIPQLAVAVDLNPQTLYNYLNQNPKKQTAINADSLEEILNFLGKEYFDIKITKK